MYIPMFIALMVRCRELSFVKRFILPALGVSCCLFMCYCCWVGKGYQQVLGYLVFLAIDFFIAFLLKGKAETLE